MPQLQTRRRDLAELTDEAVVAEARAGAGAAFALLMQRHNRRAFRVAWSLLRNRVEAEDVVQEAYLKAFAGLSGFSGESSFATWLTRIVVNEALMRRRQWDRRVENAAPATLLPLEPPPGSVAAGESPEAARGREELRQRLERAIAALPDDQRAVFVLRAVEGLSAEETAALLGINPLTVKTRLFRARRRLREALQRQLADAFRELLPFAGARCAALGNRVLERLQALGLVQPP
jgi:RNA polymerase sigma-70 factor (ECF subfamily)